MYSEGTIRNRATHICNCIRLLNILRFSQYPNVRTIKGHIITE